MASRSTPKTKSVSPLSIRPNSLITELFLNGYSIDEISIECGISQSEIRQECDLITAQWEALMTTDPTRAELRTIHSLERLYRRMAHSVIFPDDQTAGEQSTPERHLKRGTRTHEALDIKPLQGIERCIELRMRLLLNSTTTQNSTDTQQEQLSVNLSKLSRETLLELLEACK